MNIQIFTVANWNAFIELMQALAFSLEELGHTAHVMQDSVVEFPHADCYIGITAHRPFDTNLLPKKSLKIIFQVEELWNRRERGVYDKCGGWDYALELYEENCRIPIGTENVRHCPMGWSQAFGSPDPGITEDIDCAFFGSITERRQLWGSILQKNITNTQFSEGLWGSARDLLIHRTKVNINIKAHELWSYAPLRSLLIQGRGKFLLCEKASGGYGPFTPGKHFDEFDTQKEMLTKARWWLEHLQERNAFAQAALQDLRENHSFTKYLQAALRGILC